MTQKMNMQLSPWMGYTAASNVNSKPSIINWTGSEADLSPGSGSSLMTWKPRSGTEATQTTRNSMYVMNAWNNLALSAAARERRVPWSKDAMFNERVPLAKATTSSEYRMRNTSRMRSQQMS